MHYLYYLYYGQNGPMNMHLGAVGKFLLFAVVLISFPLIMYRLCVITSTQFNTPHDSELIDTDTMRENLFFPYQVMNVPRYIMRQLATVRHTSPLQFMILEGGSNAPTPEYFLQLGDDTNVKEFSHHIKEQGYVRPHVLALDSTELLIDKLYCNVKTTHTPITDILHAFHISPILSKYKHRKLREVMAKITMAENHKTSKSPIHEWIYDFYKIYEDCHGCTRTVAEENSQTFRRHKSEGDAVSFQVAYCVVTAGVMSCLGISLLTFERTFNWFSRQTFSLKSIFRCKKAPSDNGINRISRLDRMSNKIQFIQTRATNSIGSVSMSRYSGLRQTQSRMTSRSIVSGSKVQSAMTTQSIAKSIASIKKESSFAREESRKSVAKVPWREKVKTCTHSTITPKRDSVRAYTRNRLYGSKPEATSYDKKDVRELDNDLRRKKLDMLKEGETATDWLGVSSTTRDLTSYGKPLSSNKSKTQRIRQNLVTLRMSALEEESV